MEKMIKEILNKLNYMEEKLEHIEENQKNIQTDIKDLKQGQNEIKEYFNKLDAKNAERHVEAFTKISNIGKDIKFIKHKLHQTEEDVFDIKDYLKIIK